MNGDRMEAMARGILIGSGMGGLASLLGLMELKRAVLLGMLCGVLAVVSRNIRRPKE